MPSPSVPPLSILNSPSITQTLISDRCSLDMDFSSSAENSPRDADPKQMKDVVVTDNSFEENSVEPFRTRSRKRCSQVSSPLFAKSSLIRANAVVWKFARFMGPGAIIAVAYIDPDNYQTAVSAGVSFKYKLLFVILFTNVVSIYLQVRWICILFCSLYCAKSHRVFKTDEISRHWLVNWDA